ncbi:MAG: hypothetical protein HY303_09220 [Candidatus Wallbacteria bacterium]|nr:hypothetical protein [Candidatus Wallbacteria bacterium]
MPRMRHGARVFFQAALALGLVGFAMAQDPVGPLIRKAIVLRQRVLEQTRFTVAPRQLPLAGKNEKLLLLDQLGDPWLFKVEDTAHPISLHGEVAASMLSVAADGRVPPVHSVSLIINSESVHGSVQRLLPITSTLETVQPEKLSRVQLEEVLELQVFDWMAGDNDTKGDNKGVLGDGGLVNFDKSQFWRFVGSDRLDWTYHPNARPGNRPEFNVLIEPYTNKVWKSWIAGKLELDPAPLERAIERWELVDDRLVVELLQGFAWMRSVILGSDDAYTARAFLVWVLQRKRTLRAEFSAFLARASRARGRGAIAFAGQREIGETRRQESIRLHELIAGLEARLARLAKARATRPSGADSLEVPIDQEARLRILKFETSNEPFESALRDLLELRRRRAHPMARAGIDEYVERLRRFQRGEVPRRDMERVLHGRGY